MASDWIKMRRGLRHDPKVVAIARDLGGRREFMDWWSDPQRMSCREHVTEIVTFANVTRVTVCALLDVWSALNNSLGSDGKAPFMTLQDIDDIAEIPCLGEAMASVGWVVENGSDGLIFPNFWEHNTTSKDRGTPKSNAERQKEYRERKKAQSEQGKALRNVTREKRREEKSIIEREQCAGEEPEPDLPEAEIPSVDDVVSYGGLVGCSEEMCRKFYTHYDGNNLWRNQHDKAIKWRIKLVGWRSREHEHKPKGSNFERQGTVSESVAIIRDTKALERAEARRRQIREKYDMHMDWSLEDRQEDRKLRETIEILKKQLGFAA